MLPFAKIHGCGNSFILIHDQGQKLNVIKASFSRYICHEHWGLGADGFILIEPTPDQATSFKMTYLNADGSDGKLCGNGLRCAARCGYELGFFKDHTKILTDAGILSVYRLDNSHFRVEIPLLQQVQFNLDLSQTNPCFQSFDFLDTGVPHLVVGLTHMDIKKLPVAEWGQELRWHPYFSPHGTNVNFIQSLPNGKVAIRTFERGVENETLSCGTGAVAAAIISHYRYSLPSPIHLSTPGGELAVEFHTKNHLVSDLFLSGPTMIIAQGFISPEWLNQHWPDRGWQNI